MQTSITSPDDLITTVPYLLGFEPEECLVLVWIAGEYIALTQRLDLADVAQATSDWHALVAPAFGVGAHQVVAITFTCALPTAAVRQVPAALQRAGAVVLDALVTDQRTWTSLLCDDVCCPPEGRDIDRRNASRIAADFVLEGVAVCANREALRKEILPDPQLVNRTTQSMSTLPNWKQRSAWFEECLRQWQPVNRQRTIRARAIATHLVATRDVAVRDGLTWQLGQLDQGQLRAVGWFLRSILRGMPTGEGAPVATLAAIASWLLGDGARAQICLDRALHDDPDYRLARIIQTGVGAGLPPGEYRALLRSMPTDALFANLGYSSAQVKSVSVKPRLADRQPSNRGGVLPGEDQAPR
jgi:hypothetical protein